MRTTHRPIVMTVLVSLLARPCAAFPPHPVPHARELMQQEKYPEAADALDAYLATNRFDGIAWSNLGVCLYHTKDYTRAIDASLRAIELGVNPSGEMYNIACIHALNDRPDDAIDWLTRAFDAGHADQDWVAQDADLHPLRADPRFIALTGLNPPPLDAPTDQWAWDLDFLIRRMEQMHWDLYAHTTPGEFRAAVAKLKSDAPSLSSERARLRLQRILATIGDGHTRCSAFREGQDTVSRVPVQMSIFSDGVFITAAPPALRDLIGAQVIRAGDMKIDEAIRRIRPYCSTDNEQTALTDIPLFLTNPAMLQDIGALPQDATDAEYELRMPAGEPRTVSLAPEELTHGGLMAKYPDLVSGADLAPSPRPLYLSDTDTPLWMRHLEAPSAVYFCFQQVNDNPEQPFAQFIAELMRTVEETSAEHLIIDMRRNGGGNTGLVMPLIHALIRNERINQPGRLFVIIGRNTFSAAQNTANMIEIHTSATFVGEPTGSRPTFVGESTSFVLPYSKLRVYCSSRYWQFLTSTDRRTWIQPQIAAEVSSRDYFENRDPCMDAILARITKAPQAD